MTYLAAWEDLVWEPTASGAYCNIFNTNTSTLDRVDVSLRRLDPGSTWTAPAGAAESIAVVKSGDLEVTINGAGSLATARDLVFLGSDDVIAFTNSSSEPAVLWVSTFYTEATRDPRLRAPKEHAFSSAVLPWVDTVAKSQTRAPGQAATYHERRQSMPYVRTATSPLAHAHFTVVKRDTPLAQFGRHRDATLFFFFEGRFDLDIEGTTYHTGPGSFFYLPEEAAHGQVPVGDVDSAYLVVHIWSQKSEAKLTQYGSAPTPVPLPS